MYGERSVRRGLHWSNPLGIKCASRESDGELTASPYIELQTALSISAPEFSRGFQHVFLPRLRRPMCGSGYALPEIMGILLELRP